MSSPLDNPSTFVGGQIKDHLSEWRKISGDPWVLGSVTGVTIPFVELPVQDREPHPYRLSAEESEFVDSEVGRMLEKGILEIADPVEGQVISNVFLRPKKDGSFRMILDLTWVNTFVEYEHFKMHSIQTATDMMREGCWMSSIDLKDAYYSVPVTVGQRRFLRFRWGDQLLQFRVLPNGLACAPRFFTKLLVPIYATLRERGCECFPYIDDSFIVADSAEKCEDTTRQLQGLLENLGFVIHLKKSETTPTKKLVFLGYELDSEVMRISLTKEKEDKLLLAATDLVQKTTPTIREVAGLVGLLVAFSQAFSYGAIHSKNLEMNKIEALQRARGDFDQKMSLSDLARADIQWWITNVRRSGRPLELEKPEMTLFTDASEEGWGAHVNERATGGRWSEEEKLDHINILELRAILFGLQSLCQEVESHVKIMTDNTTAMAYVRHQGGVKSPGCHEVAEQIWSWAEERQVWLSIAHIPGVDNHLADYKSRHFADNLEWEVSDRIWSKIVHVFRQQPDIDLFASRLNRKVNCYVSWMPDPNAYAIDAFMLDWSEFNCFYAFPPFSVVGRAIEKIVREEARGILVVPHWTSRPWWGRLESLKLRRLTFRERKGNLKASGNPNNVDFLSRSPLVAFLFSRNPY